LEGYVTFWADLIFDDLLTSTVLIIKGDMTVLISPTPNFGD